LLLQNLEKSDNIIAQLKINLSQKESTLELLDNSLKNSNANTKNEIITLKDNIASLNIKLQDEESTKQTL